MIAKSDVFAEYWEQMEIAAHSEGVRAINVPDVGEIKFRHTSFAIERSPSQRLLVFAPLEESDAQRLRLLAEHSDT
jgi:hypothetical protein